MKTRSNFSALLQAFFTDRLMRQRQVSPETIASYRDAFCLLFRFVRQHLNKAPSVLEMEDFEAPLIVAFSLLVGRKSEATVRALVMPG